MMYDEEEHDQKAVVFYFYTNKGRNVVDLMIAAKQPITAADAKAAFLDFLENNMADGEDFNYLLGHDGDGNALETT